MLIREADGADRGAAGDFPRVLFLTSLAFNHITGGGVTFSNLFRGWPKDRLFTAHNDRIAVTTDVCTNYFTLTQDEIGKWGPLRLIQPAATANGPVVAATSEGASTARRLRDAVFGADEVPESVRLTPRLEAWIESIRPDLVYTCLGSNSWMRLTDAVRRRFGLPLVVHIMDDWRATKYQHGLISGWRRATMQRRLAGLVRQAAARLGIGDAMCRAYTDDYGVNFQPFQNTIDTEDWLRRAPPAGRKTGGALRLVYAGSILAFAQLESLVDLCRLVARLATQGRDVRLDIYSPDFMTAPHRRRLEAGPAVRVHKPIPHGPEYFRRLCEADILLLPVNFDHATVEFIRYSIPTKVPEYMLTGVPILVYGPREVAQVSYAEEYGWGHVVGQRDEGALETALDRLARDDGLRARLGATARRVATERHNAETVRRDFRAVLAAAATARQFQEKIA